MKAFKVLGVLWLLLVVVTVVAVAASAPSADGPDTRQRTGVIGDVGQLDMLESDQQMLERMRNSLSPSMNTMIQNDPMWTDPEMIRAQEEYQAQLDRMIARRTERP